MWENSKPETSQRFAFLDWHLCLGDPPQFQEIRKRVKWRFLTIKICPTSTQFKILSRGERLISKEGIVGQVFAICCKKSAERLSEKQAGHLEQNAFLCNNWRERAIKEKTEIHFSPLLQRHNEMQPQDMLNFEQNSVMFTLYLAGDFACPHSSVRLSNIILGNIKWPEKKKRHWL